MCNDEQNRSKIEERGNNRKDKKTSAEASNIEAILSTKLILEYYRKTNKNESSRGMSTAAKKEIENTLITITSNEVIKEVTELQQNFPKGHQIGSESCVWFVNSKVIKLVDPYSYLKNEGIKGDVWDFVEDKIELFNVLFEDSQYSLKGFIRTKVWDDIFERYKNSFRAIVEQPFVLGVSFRNIIQNYNNLDKINNRNYKKIIDYLKPLLKDCKTDQEVRNILSELIIKDLNYRTGENFSHMKGISKYISKDLYVNDLHGDNVMFVLDVNKDLKIAYIDANPIMNKK